MPNPLLEITVEALDAGVAAERAGADRVELCSELNTGGITPSVATMRKLHEELEIPVFSVVRPRAGDYVYSDGEFAIMKRDIAVARDLGMEGVVFGILYPDATIDIDRTAELVDLARPLEVTFHRAFDLAPSPLAALEDVTATGATRILTSGGTVRASDGIGTLRKLVDAARDRIVVMPGGGLDATNIIRLAVETGAHEFHTGLGSVLPYGKSNPAKFEAEIHAMKRLLRDGLARPAATR
jgi:copper homeostasis protein